jgi:hypothetical protein
MANKEYEVTLTIIYLVSAPNEEAANDRADLIAEGAQDGILKLKQRWAPDEMEIEYTIEVSDA